MENFETKDPLENYADFRLSDVLIPLGIVLFLLACLCSCTQDEVTVVKAVLPAEAMTQTTQEERVLLEYVKLGRKDEPFVKFPMLPAAVIAHETNGLTSALYKKSNNMFGIKCFSRSCPKGHCVNFTDDSSKDFFVKFKTRWEAYDRFRNLARTKYKACYRESTIEGCLACYKRIGYATSKSWPTHVAERYSQITNLARRLGQ